MGAYYRRPYRAAVASRAGAAANTPREGAKMKGKIDTFDAWFEAQHGGRTDSGMVGHTDRDLRDIIYYAKDAKHVIAPRQLWDEQRKAALYAWNARGLRK